MYYEWTEIFDYEDRSPCYLRAQVFDIDGALVSKTGF